MLRKAWINNHIKKKRETKKKILTENKIKEKTIIINEIEDEFIFN